MNTRTRGQPWWQGNSWNRPQGDETPYGNDNRALPVGFPTRDQLSAMRQAGRPVQPARPPRGGLSRYARDTVKTPGSPVRPGPAKPATASERGRTEAPAAKPDPDASMQAPVKTTEKWSDIAGKGKLSYYARGTGRLSGGKHKMPDGHMMDDHDPSMKPGGGGRFAALKGKLEKKGAKSPGGLAAFIGRKKYGKGKFQSMAAKGKK